MTVRLYTREVEEGTSRFAEGSSFELDGEYPGLDSARLEMRVREIREAGRIELLLGEPQRYLGRCRSCKAPHSALVDTVQRRRTVGYGRSTWVLEAAGVQLTDERVTVDQNVGIAVRCDCGKLVGLSRVKGTHNPDVACDARCMNATGPNCECSCGGANHGASHGH